MSGNPHLALVQVWLRPVVGSDVHPVQSRVVTKIGLWLLPEPAATLTMAIDLPKVGRAWAIDILSRSNPRGWLNRTRRCRAGCGRRVRLQREQWYRWGRPHAESAIRPC